MHMAGISWDQIEEIARNRVDDDDDEGGYMK